MKGLEGYSDEDFKRTIRRAIRLVTIVAVTATPLVWWKAGWASAALLVVGAVISGTGLWEWLRLMSAVMVHMDAGGAAKPMAGVLVGFFLRLGVAIVLLYGSLKYLDGSVYALAAGLALGVVCLSIEGLRMLNAWTA